MFYFIYDQSSPKKQVIRFALTTISLPGLICGDVPFVEVIPG